MTNQTDVGAKIERLERAAHLLTLEPARNQLMKLSMFATEESGLLFIQSLAPPA